MGNVLVTGGTGFLGRQFVRELAEKTTDNIYVLVRPHKTDQEIRTQVSSLEKDNVHVIKGDITHPGVVMEESPKLSEIWHLAGSTDFQESRRAQTTDQNVKGVHNLVALGQKHDVDRFFHTSTAYVAGVHHGTVYEDQLLDRPDFRNVYEETKYEGEVIVRGSGLNYLILRPSIVMGHSQTGEVDSDKMVYGVLKLYNKFIQGMKKFVKGAPPEDLRYFVKGKPTATKNLITVDDVITLMLAVGENGQVGRTYHLCNPESTTIQNLNENILEVLGVDYFHVEPEYQAIEEFGQSLIDRGVGLYERYMLEPDPVYDISNTKSVMNGMKIRPFDDGFQQFLYKKYLECRCRN